MTAAASPTIPAAITCAAIEWYQRYVSPRKGFSCARRVLRGGASCSQFAKRALSRCGLAAGVRPVRRRFEKCHAAQQILDYERRPSEKRNHYPSDARGCPDLKPLSPDDAAAMACLA